VLVELVCERWLLKGDGVVTVCPMLSKRDLRGYLWLWRRLLPCRGATPWPVVLVFSRRPSWCRQQLINGGHLL